MREDRAEKTSRKLLSSSLKYLLPWSLPPATSPALLRTSCTQAPPGRCFSHHLISIHTTEQPWSTNTAALHGDTKLPQEGTWCIPGTTQQLGWNETPLWTHGVELLLTAAESLWQSSPAGSHCSWTQTQPEASISHHLQPGNRESLILFSSATAFISLVLCLNFLMSNQGQWLCFSLIKHNIKENTLWRGCRSSLRSLFP